ncbi:MAG: hypothetical protein EZS28_042315, partial [Streblomastix strix]
AIGCGAGIGCRDGSIVIKDYTLQSNIHSPKGRWEMEKSARLQVTQLGIITGALHDGEREHSNGISLVIKLCYIAEHRESLSSHESDQRTAEIFRIPIQRQSFHVRWTPICVELKPNGFLQDHEASYSCNPRKVKDQGNLINKRRSVDEVEQEAIEAGYYPNNQISGRSRQENAEIKMLDNTSQGLRIFRMGVRYNENGNPDHGEEEKTSKIRDPKMDQTNQQLSNCQDQKHFISD